MAEKTPQSTVRNRKQNAASTQRFLPIAEIRQNTILLKNGGLRAIIEVEAINFNLKSETEQQGIIAGYGSFVNTLTFPLQILIRSRRANIDDYLMQIKTAGEKQQNELLRSQTVSYVSFMQKLIDVADIMQKSFYVIVPLDRAVRKKTLIEQFFDWLHTDDSSSKAGLRSKELTENLKQLNERVELVSSGLTNIGLHPKRMETRELVELLYQVMNPKTSQNQKIPDDTGMLKLEEMAL